MRTRVCLVIAVMLVAGVVGFDQQPAEATPKRILFYGPSLVKNTAYYTNEVAVARALGHAVTVASATEWSNMTTSDFQSYDAIVFGDPCSEDRSRLEAAEANKAVWSAAVTGPIALNGAVPTCRYYRGDALSLTSNSINFAASGSGTGLYVSLSYYYYDAAANTPVSVLSRFGAFEVQGYITPPLGHCPNRVEIVDATHPVMDRVSGSGLSYWHCSIYEVFTEYPSSFEVLAREKATDLPYIIATEEQDPDFRGPDLVLRKSGPDEATEGDTLTYRIGISNGGPGRASGVTVEDPLPAGVKFQSASASQGSCGGAATVTCDLGGVDEGATATVTIVVEATSAGTITNAAGVSANEQDPDTGDNVGTKMTTVSPVMEHEADLRVVKSQSPDRAEVGADLTYTIEVTNGGPDQADNVMATDSLPSGLAYVSALSTGGACTGTTDISCDMGSLAAGQNGTVTIVVRPAVPGTETNTARVRADVIDPNIDNNEATVVTTVNAPGCTITGTPGDNRLIGTPGDDVICGQGGDDSVEAGGGNDYVILGDGDDRVKTGPGNDVIRASDGNDRGDAGRGADTILAGRGDDTFTGGAGRDAILGHRGDDRLSGSDDRDFIDGGRQHDTVRGGRDGDFILGFNGQDYLKGDRGNDRVFGEKDADHIIGDRGRDHLNSRDESGQDFVDGGKDKDRCVTDAKDSKRNCQ